MFHRLCVEDGTWSQDPPTCKEITCNDPDLVENLLVDAGTKLVGSVAKYSCTKGHTLIGNNTRVCSSTGQWIGRIPKCKGKTLIIFSMKLVNPLTLSHIPAVDCGRPLEIENGRVIVINESTLYGGAAEYHCVPHYNRIGQFLRKCMEDGKWSGDEPRCECKS